MLLFRKLISSSFLARGNWAPTWKYLSPSDSTTTFSNSSDINPFESAPSSSLGLVNCYGTSSNVVEASCNDCCLVAATKHYLATTWLPTNFPTCPPMGYLTFKCKVDDTAPSACSQVWEAAKRCISKKERFFECFLGHLSFWVSGVKSPLIFYTKNKKNYILKKKKYMIELFPFIDWIKKYIFEKLKITRLWVLVTFYPK